MLEIKVKILPSIEKCFLDEKIESKPELSEISMLRNERLSFQFAYTYDDLAASPKQYCRLNVEGPLADYIKIARIEPVPVFLPAYPNSHDDNYLRTEPGLYPDLLDPLDINRSRFNFGRRQNVREAENKGGRRAAARAGAYPYTVVP